MTVEEASDPTIDARKQEKHQTGALEIRKKRRSVWVFFLEVGGKLI